MNDPESSGREKKTQNKALFTGNKYFLENNVWGATLYLLFPAYIVTSSVKVLPYNLGMTQNPVENCETIN